MRTDMETVLNETVTWSGTSCNITEFGMIPYASLWTIITMEKSHGALILILLSHYPARYKSGSDQMSKPGKSNMVIEVTKWADKTQIYHATVWVLVAASREVWCESAVSAIYQSLPKAITFRTIHTGWLSLVKIRYRPSTCIFRLFLRNAIYC